LLFIMAFLQFAIS